ncbi:hypothetical protein ACH4UR_02340 [Streptomyces lydicus]|uniref:hypothetical protein n=1 Tax=Streptomyces lydicus TaxID=47763 RepID=UPI0033C6A878
MQVVEGGGGRILLALRHTQQCGKGGIAGAGTTHTAYATRRSFAQYTDEKGVVGSMAA